MLILDTVSVLLEHHSRLCLVSDSEENGMEDKERLFDVPIRMVSDINQQVGPTPTHFFMFSSSLIYLRSSLFVHSSFFYLYLLSLLFAVTKSEFDTLFLLSNSLFHFFRAIISHIM